MPAAMYARRNAADSMSRKGSEIVQMHRSNVSVLGIHLMPEFLSWLQCDRLQKTDEDLEYRSVFDIVMSSSRIYQALEWSTTMKTMSEGTI